MQVFVQYELYFAWVAEKGIHPVSLHFKEADRKSNKLNLSFNR
jgi:hypothetical protein